MGKYDPNDAVLYAADNVVDWLLDHNYKNVVLDVCNECDLCRVTEGRYCSEGRMALRALNWPPLGDHGTLIERIRTRAKARDATLYLSTSYVGGNLPEYSKGALGPRRARREPPRSKRKQRPTGHAPGNDPPCL